MLSLLLLAGLGYVWNRDRPAGTAHRASGGNPSGRGRRRSMSDDAHAAPVAARRAVRLVEFNLHPAGFAHRSWFGALSGERSMCEAIFAAEGRAAERSEPGLSCWLLEELGLQGEMDWG